MRELKGGEVKAAEYEQLSDQQKRYLYDTGKYAEVHGREVTLDDRPYIDAVYQVSKSHKYSLRATIEAIVAHPEYGGK